MVVADRPAKIKAAPSGTDRELPSVKPLAHPVEGRDPPHGWRFTCAPASEFVEQLGLFAVIVFLRDEILFAQILQEAQFCCKGIGLR